MVKYDNRKLLIMLQPMPYHPQTKIDLSGIVEAEAEELSINPLMISFKVTLRNGSVSRMVLSRKDNGHFHHDYRNDVQLNVHALDILRTIYNINSQS